MDGQGYEAFRDALLDVDRIRAKRCYREMLADVPDGAQAEELLIEVLEEIGTGWEKGRFSLAQVYMAGVIAEELIDAVIEKGPPETAGGARLAIGVLLDHHALGKRVVQSVLRAAGYEVLDLGMGLTPREMVDAALAADTQVLLISCLMFPSALRVRDVRTMLDEAGSSMKVVVGGAPYRLDPELWRDVGADAFGSNAGQAVGVVERMVKA